MRDPATATVLGSGPNGLAAAITLARAGLSVTVIEGAATPGGGVRSAPFPQTGFVRDVCAAIFPLALGASFLPSLPLAEHGLRWINPPATLAHPFDDAPAVLVTRDLAETVEGLGVDGPAYRRLFGPLVAAWPALSATVLAPLRLLPRHPLALAGFGLRAAWPATALARLSFRTPRARALLAGQAAHGMVALEAPFAAASAALLGTAAHAVGWPLPEGGAQRLADALVAYLKTLGGRVITGAWVRDLAELPPAAVTLLDVTPRQFLALAGGRLASAARRPYARYRYGPGVFKIDYALRAPIPWRDPACAQAPTVHLGGTLAEVAASERAAWRGEPGPRPFVLLTQPSLFDATRAPAGAHTAWAYCHVPHGDTRDHGEAITAQIERFAPGFRDLILETVRVTAAGYEAYNPNVVGGDISGGANDAVQLLFRPTLSTNPYATPLEGVYLCSSATPPGPGAHGMCGHHAARAALAALSGRRG
ncbi:MAG: NAD(P)/FAD-dependent oxidoreductase [Thermoflexales bacterium]|nr:NAD(P)/FAD-dependent oxidoreductase [Thermoflexales bacterium]